MNKASKSTWEEYEDRFYVVIKAWENGDRIEEPYVFDKGTDEVEAIKEALEQFKEEHKNARIDEIYLTEILF